MIVFKENYPHIGVKTIINLLIKRTYISTHIIIIILLSIFCNQGSYNTTVRKISILYIV